MKFEKPYIKCSDCWGEIYEGEPYGERGGKIICDQCVTDEWESKNIADKIVSLGYQYCEATFGKVTDDV